MNAKGKGVLLVLFPNSPFRMMIYRRVAAPRAGMISEKLETVGEYLRRKEKKRKTPFTARGFFVVMSLGTIQVGTRIPSLLFSGCFCSRAWLPSFR